MIIDSVRSLRMVLDAAGTDVIAHVTYQDVNPQGDATPGTTTSTASSGTTPVTILASPSGNLRSHVTEISIYNGNAATRVVSVSTLVSATTTGIVKKTLLTGESLHYSNTAGWYPVGA